MSGGWTGFFSLQLVVSDSHEHPVACIPTPHCTFPLLPLRTCCVCLDDVRKGDHCSLLPCCHCFHSKCIEQWLLRSNSCPVCRTTVF